MVKFATLLLISLAACASSGSYRERQHERMTKYWPAMETLALETLKKTFPKGGHYWAGWDLSAFENGNPIEIEGYALKNDSIEFRFSETPPVANAVGEVTFSQGAKAAPLEVNFQFEIHGDQMTMPAEKAPGSFPQQNPSFTAGLVLTKDPIGKLRRNQKELKAINERRPFVGMSEEALKIAMPNMRANYQHIADRVTIQYVAKVGYYIYVENGKVTAVQRF